MRIGLIHILLLAFCGVQLCTAAVCYAQAIAVRLRRPDLVPKVYGRVEWVVEPGTAYGNPFDTDEVAIDAHFSGPNGQTLVLPAFWSQQFMNNRFGHDNDQKAVPDDAGAWLVRFCPPAAGAWSMQVVVQDRTGRRESDRSAFTVAATDAPGFVRRAPNNARYYQFDSGRAFFPIGLNIAWPSRVGLDECEKYFSRLADAGGNFARVWMSHPNRMTETVEAGVGRFDLSAMEYYDAVLTLAEERGIFVMLTLNNHRDLLEADQYGKAIWGRFPYNAANGGPATRPADFITSQACRDLYKRRLRYLVARYSAFANIAFWEFFNEQEFTRVDVSLDWVREMSDYLKANDPYGHLVTTSARIPPDQWRLPNIDLTQSHLYVGGSTDVISPIVSSARRHDQFNKPHVVAELGIGEGHDAVHDTKGIGTAVHQGIWASAMAGCAGSSWHWWWDNYVDPKNLWHVYSGLSKFAASVDRPRQDFRPIDLLLPELAHELPEEFFDMTIACTENWGYTVDGDVVVQPNGRLNQALPHYFVSPAKESLFRPVRLRVDLPKPTTMVVRVQRVSDVGVIRIAVDDQPVVDFPFSALPGAPDQKRTRARPGSTSRYEATFQVDRSVDVPAGPQVITIANVAGDWVSLESITFRNVQSSRRQLAALAMQDASVGQTIAWIYDTRWNWRSDQDGIKPTRFDAATVVVPIVTDGQYTVEWWDTRSGSVLNKAVHTSAQNSLKLTIPSFTRDIALRVYRLQ